MPGDIETTVELKASHSNICRFDTRISADLDLYKKVRHGVRLIQEKALHMSHLSSLPPIPMTDPVEHQSRNATALGLSGA
jgi:hypothetical protein